MTTLFTMGNQRIGPPTPVYIVAEISANHHQNYAQAEQLIQAAKTAGADAVKLQTFTPDTMTLDCDNEFFQIRMGNIWQGQRLYDLYRDAYMPWEWQPKLQALAEDLDLALFSTPYDETAVDFLETMAVPAYKIASFELLDLPLIRRVARTGKPLLMSVGMATPAEIALAVRTARDAGNTQLALLQCTSAYPAPASEMQLRTIPYLADTFDVVAGLSDHTLGIAAPVAALALGARIIEKHLTLSRATPGADSAFSLEPQEFRCMVDAVRSAEQALDGVRDGATAHEEVSRLYRRSLFVVKAMQAGEEFTRDNVRSIRPGFGLPPQEIDTILGRRAACPLDAGMPLRWDLVAGCAVDGSEFRVQSSELMVDG